MARRSKWPNQEMWDQAVQWKRGGLSYTSICGQLAKPENMKRFGLKEVPSEDTVRRQVTRHLSGVWPLSSGADPKQHRDTLMAPLLDFQGIGPFGIHDYDLAVWHSRPDDPCWPIAKGQVCRDKPGKLRVHLAVEDTLECRYLQEHLAGDPVWQSIEEWKQAMCADLNARLTLLGAVIQRTEVPADKGGLGWPVIAENGPTFVRMAQARGHAVSLYYAFRLYDQALSRCLGLRHAGYERQHFVPFGGDGVELGGNLVICAPEENRREEAITFFLKAQEELRYLPQAHSAVYVYRRVEEQTVVTKQQVERLRLTVGFPPGSVCDGCRDWAIPAGTGSP